MLILGFGALAAAAVKKLLTPPEPAWQSTPTSGRDYSSAPAGTTSRPESPSANGKTDAPKAESPKPDTAKTDTAKPDTAKPADTAKTEATKADAEAKAAANGATSNGPAAKKTTTSRKPTGSTESKPTDS